MAIRIGILGSCVYEDIFRSVHNDYRKHFEKVFFSCKNFADKFILGKISV